MIEYVSSSIARHLYNIEGNITDILSYFCKSLDELVNRYSQDPGWNTSYWGKKSSTKRFKPSTQALTYREDVYKPCARQPNVTEPLQSDMNNLNKTVLVRFDIDGVHRLQEEKKMKKRNLEQ